MFKVDDAALPLSSTRVILTGTMESGTPSKPSPRFIAQTSRLKPSGSTSP
eukprot:CAMPEP_0185177010 /NCGR_PEP_ID=MMETSP1139-20130426/29116_1 /TAXON_ID=298111 /ORGANISM="Pavlova sp., Strain CCMP459" /LENGTH=49 /DNA_ID=CAMNT_0027742791 /DNA_START=310 /DNA_END=459 /DNA_ORIENTATION=+